MARFTLFALLATIIIAAMAIGIQVIISTAPHLLLKVPRIGYILHALLAKGRIPPHLDSRIYEAEGWMRPGDVVVSVPAKAGTHWLMYTVYLMRSRGDDTHLKDLYSETPWPELVYYPGQAIEERASFLKNLSTKYPFSIYKSHLSPGDFKVRPDVKYIVGVRNPYDVVASLRTFFQIIDPSFAKMWGGFPPAAGKEDLLPEKEWETFLTVNSGDGTPFLSRLLQPTATWWPYRRHSNVLFVHYTNRLKNDHVELGRIARFLNLNLSDSELSGIARKVSFLEMKRTTRGKLDFHEVFDHFKSLGKVSQDVVVFNKKVDSPVIAKGPERSGVRETSDTIKSRIWETLLNTFGSHITSWIEEGGDFPMDAELPQVEEHTSSSW